MQELAVFAGRLVGAAINPLVWICALGSAFLLRKHGLLVRVIGAVVATALVGAALYSLDPTLPMSAKVRGVFFASLAAAIIVLVGIAITRLARR